MMNFIWAGIMLASMIYAATQGKLPDTVNAGISAAGGSITSVISFAGIMCMWSGIMNIAQKGGLIRVLSRITRPIMKHLFKSVPQDSEAMGYMNTNIACNILGLGNAATPSGMQAMCALRKLNGDKDEASQDMCMFMIMNTASIQLIPTTMIALRAAAGSHNPSEIVLPIWIASFSSLLTGILCVKLFEKIKQRIGKRY